MTVNVSFNKLTPRGSIYYNAPVSKLVKKSLENKEAILSRIGALVVYTGHYSGRSPKDRFIVDTEGVHKEIDWGEINVPISEKKFENLYQKLGRHLSLKDEIFVFDGFVGAQEKYKIPLRVVCEYAYQALFATYLMRRPSKSERIVHHPELTVLCVPSFKADPKADGTNSEAFIILNFDKKIVLIGGTKYSGEIKKAVFTVMNYLLPQKGVFPMHCSANMGKRGETALFFGLSGTGKTTLSADANRFLIGDDEHGWSEQGIFNFEGGCYAKCIDLAPEKEPQIWKAIKKSTILENVVLKEDNLDFSDRKFTENTRAAYPIEYIEKIVLKGIGNHPKYIIFLTADAFGVFPPVARLNTKAAIYHFMSGYTSKLAGTERGITIPKAVFSACFGAPFMPRPAFTYASLLKKYMTKYKSKVYLVNTGWSGGHYGVGERISLVNTRKIIDAILAGKLDKIKYHNEKFFNLNVPTSVEGVNDAILTPRNLWRDKKAYDKTSYELASFFITNFKKFKDIQGEIIRAGPGGAKIV